MDVEKIRTANTHEIYSLAADSHVAVLMLRHQLLLLQTSTPEVFALEPCPPAAQQRFSL
jgi:hypothetical protein